LAGGVIEATGPSGATYRLEIPPEALAVETTITMTPLSELTGFGSLDASLEHMLGVELEPDGLQLAAPARLTMSSEAAMPDAGVATGSYLGDGAEAGLVLAERSGSTVGIEVAHFSGYYSVWPLQMEHWRELELDFQAADEAAFEHELAVILGVLRLRQLFGLETPRYEEVVRNEFEYFEKVMLDGRLALSQNGCTEARLAMTAFVAYERQLQLLGVADDEALYAELKRPIPPALYDLTWNLCLDEEYQRCAATGDWPRLAMFLLTQLKQRAIMEFPLTTEQTLEGTDRLKRCGHWRVTLNTSENLFVPGAGLVGGEAQVWQEWTSEIEVQFRGDGDYPFGLSDRAVGYGEADIQVTRLDVTHSGADLPASIRNIRTVIPAQARITGMAFVTPKDSLVSKPDSLKVQFEPGTVAFEVLHVGGFYAGEYIPEEVNWRSSSQLIFGKYPPPTIEKEWEFGSSPYIAKFGRFGSGGEVGYRMESSIEIIVDHTPD
jgi:hypothetical protein